MTRESYDPVWSPDGEWIAFVSLENESDDIWRSRPDASQQESLMRNEWEWDLSLIHISEPTRPY